MDVLLVQPPVRDFYFTAKRSIPYGLSCIAAALQQSGFTVEIIDGLATSKSKTADPPAEMSYLDAFYGRADISPFALFHRYRHFGYSFEHIGNQVRRYRPFLVGISSLFTAYSQEALRCAESIKKFHPDCKIVMGGHHPTVMPDRVMQASQVDFILRGEGEVSMPLLAEAIRDKECLENIPGIVFRRNDGSLHIGEPAEMNDLDAYPLPAAKLIRHTYYQRAKKPCAVITTSRGCPMQCSYCCMGTSVPSYRRRSIDAVFQEIETAAREYKAAFIDFEDENLSLDRKWFMALLDQIIRRFGHGRLELRAMNGLFPPSLDEPMVKAMRNAGFKTLNLSLGSTSAAQLKKFNRPDVRKAVDNALGYAEACGLEAVCYIITGAPGQKAEDSISDLLYLCRNRVLAGVSVYYPAPGSRDFETCRQRNILPEHLSLMRSSAVPISDTTTRLEALTILRLGRIVNFMKSLIDRNICIPSPSAFTPTRPLDRYDRESVGLKLLQAFLHDGRIRGAGPDGDIYEHPVSMTLTRQFIQRLQTGTLRGIKSFQTIPLNSTPHNF